MCKSNESVFHLLSGYSVGSLISSRGSQLYVAGAPRFNHTGKVIIFTLKNSGDLTIWHALLGEQVCFNPLWPYLRESNLVDIQVSLPWCNILFSFYGLFVFLSRLGHTLAVSCYRWTLTVTDRLMSSWWQHPCTTAMAGREARFTSTLLHRRYKNHVLLQRSNQFLCNCHYSRRSCHKMITPHKSHGQIMRQKVLCTDW